ncbi:MAG: methyltransferase type 12 [Snowella sp.]|nr:MAG: methyltransferase type 12 [Snowella sp.]
MTTKTIAYTPDYFQSLAFDTDYQTLASYIVEIYHPTTVVEFGCGPGHLSRELAKLGVEVTAVDGFSRPDFTDLSVEFSPLDLNNPDAIAAFFSNKRFDLAVSLEVAEHLQPESSPTLVQWLTQVAPVVVFSAAVPCQDGHGHINLQPRDYWHKLFTQANFVIGDRIREKLRAHPSVAPWYRYNVLDYVHASHPQAPSLIEVIDRLIASESAAATGYYDESRKLYLLEQKTGITNS